MRLRRLIIEDAPLMLEWMHDDDVIHDMHTDFMSKTIKDCEKFILSCMENQNTSLHLAIVDDFDTYMGTVSLKHIDKKVQNCEFAITVRKCAMGKGYSAYAMREIINIAKEVLNLKQVIWCVSYQNKRAIRFYDKMGFKPLESVPENIIKYYVDINDLQWYIAY